jgi:hypothetical protein
MNIMQFFWKAPVSKTVRILDDASGRELFFYGITIGWLGLGFLVGKKRAATLSGLYNCEVCGQEKCPAPGICEDCLTLPTVEEIKAWEMFCECDPSYTLKYCHGIGYRCSKCGKLPK